MAEGDSCKACGKALPPGEYCPDCTLTDFDLKLSVAAAAAGLLPDAPAYLIESRTDTRFPIGSNKWKIGRDPTNQVVIPEDPYTSRFHAWITSEDGHYFVEDLGSTNGTLLNGQPLVRRRPLLSGDHLRIGRSDFMFVLETRAAGAAGVSKSSSLANET